MNKCEMALKIYDTPYGFLSWERQGIVLMHVEKEEQDKAEAENSPGETPISTQKRPQKK